MDLRDTKIYLTQTDTIVGFVSQDRGRLDIIKGRSEEKRYITALPSLSALKRCTRVPTMHRNIVRRSRRSTFIFPNGNSYRVIKEKHHIKLIRKLGWAYTTSANRSNDAYDELWARSVADVVVEPLHAKTDHPSAVYIVGRTAIRRIR